MTASVGINNLLINDLTLFNIVQLKLFGMAKVLEDFSVFVCDCNSPGKYSFLNDFLIDLDRLKFTVSACDQQSFPFTRASATFFLALS